ncbi:DUF1295 domain-containing protein [Acinetobacter sp. NIPH 1852]|uniref:DUF1295 domain-containing protein n=1 Tax=Acinetobacter sp. NIPH 1852 TaxID=2923428 RepID=UPI001F4B1982|nr:DUF1295 domain-containing protein [Acinetobacter sp. NIPH 1852]MCH7307189.1 DUF1295 domain-containing protein [Acinetobacter sp. NIPH 1852]
MLWQLFLLDAVVMTVCWLWATYNHRAGIVDVAWSFCIVLNIVMTAWLVDVAPVNVQLFIGIFSSIWFLRLSWHLLRRYLAEHEEDRRYANMRRAMGKYQHLGFFAFFMFQAGLAMLFTIPMWSLLNVPSAVWRVQSNDFLIIAGMIMAIAFIGEVIADQQLYRFKQNTQNHGKTMDQGLWRYSRHPNYFFEWIHWFAYPVLGLAAGLYSLWIYPVLMWLFLYYITGIPFSEQQALKNRGQNYLDYQKRTSMFIPWKPKE